MMNCAIRTATPAHAGVRGVNDGVDLLFGDVATHRGDFQHAASMHLGTDDNDLDGPRRVSAPDRSVTRPVPLRDLLQPMAAIGCNFASDSISLNRCHAGQHPHADAGHLQTDNSLIF